MTAIGATGMALSLLAGLFFYLSSPNQLLWAARIPRRALAWVGVVLAIVGLVQLLRWAGPATAVFIGFTAIMLVWTFVPLIAAWLRGERAKNKRGAKR